MSNTRYIPSNSAQETQQLAARLGKRLSGGEVITLSGDLGVGKTCFAQGLARGLGVQGHVNSPTFTIMKEYAGTDLPFYHMDAYRVEDELEVFGLEEYFLGNGVCLIEWPERIEAQLPWERLDIHIAYRDEGKREIKMTPSGGAYEQLLDQLISP